MKNLHVLPTDKPSRVYKHLGRELKHTVRYFEQKGLLCINQNIYITSDEEIKEGDWVLFKIVGAPFDYRIHYCKDITDEGYVVSERELNCDLLDCKKIILTTDQDLIKDGVQAINDIFLEWFVQNPSCEEVEIQCRYNFYAGQDLTHYKIIIPQEEPKQDLEKEMFELEQELDIPSSMRWHNSKPKQETLEEAAREYWKRGQFGLEKAADTELAFLKGAKSEAAKDYWFEQFKKKGGDK